MVLRLRLARFGRRHQPLYNIVLAQARSARDSKPLEVLGTYNPSPKTPLASTDTPEFATDPTTGEFLRNSNGEVMPFAAKRYKDVKLDRSRIKYWLGVGAQPSESVERLLCLVSLCFSVLGCGWGANVHGLGWIDGAETGEDKAGCRG